MFREPPFRPFHPFLKILALIMVMIITFLVVLALGVGFSIPFFGMDLLEGAAALTDYSEPRTIGLLKYLQVVNQLGVFILPAILFVMLTDDNFMGYLNLNNGFRKFSLIFGIIMLIVSLPFIGWLLEINSGLHLPAALSRVENWMRTSEDNAEKLTEAFLATSSWSGFLVNLLMVAVLAAIGEELIFRGILVRLFNEWMSNIHLAVLIPALLFSALHLQFYGFFGRLVLGIILGYLFVWSGSLWVPVIVHFINNAMAVVVSFMDQRGIITADLKTFGTSQNNGVIVGSFLLMVFTMMMIYLHERGYFKSLIKKGPDQP
jgi:membrane protease YdiL (CAAX protease family)